MPRVSIVMPVYNGQAYLPQTIDSVLRQTMPDWELVIVDDGSRDGSGAIMDHYAVQDDRIRAIHQENRGGTPTRNRGFTETDPAANYVIFLDQDDVWKPNALELLVTALDANPQAVAAHGKMRLVDNRGKPLRQLSYRRWGIAGKRLVAWPSSAPTTIDVMIIQNAISTPGQILIRRRALDSVGLFDATTTFAADWDMWLRLSGDGPIAFVDAIVIDYRQHDTNMSRQKKAIAQGDAALYNKLFNSGTLHIDRRTVALVRYRYEKRYISQLYWLWASESFAQRRLWAALKYARHAIMDLARSQLTTPPQNSENALTVSE